MNSQDQMYYTRERRRSGLVSIMHYGVKGQKWGVTRNLQRGSNRLAKTENRLLAKRLAKGDARVGKLVSGKKAMDARNNAKLHESNKKDRAKARKYDRLNPEMNGLLGKVQKNLGDKSTKTQLGRQKITDKGVAAIRTAHEANQKLDKWNVQRAQNQRQNVINSVDRAATMTVSAANKTTQTAGKVFSNKLVQSVAVGAAVGAAGVVIDRAISRHVGGPGIIDAKYTVLG